MPETNEKKQPNRSKSSFHKMLDALPTAVYTTDAEGNLTYFNPAAVEFSGREPELGTDKWCVTWKLYYPDGSDMPHEECPMAVALKEGRSDFGHEAIAERPDGKRIWFMPYPSPLFDNEGNITGGINMFVDISEQKKNERANAHLGAIVNNSDDAIISKDLNGIVQTWNKGAQNLFGYTADEAIGRSITMIFPEERLEEEDEILKTIGRDEKIDHFETIRQRNDGTLLDVSLTISPVKNNEGTIVGASKIARDITERKEADSKQKQLLREIETERQRLLDIFLRAPSMMVITEGPEHVFIQANELYKQLVGDRELIGKTMKEALPEAETQGFIDLLDQVYETGESVRKSGERVMLEARDGSGEEEYFLDFVYQPIRDSGGFVTGIFVQAVNITERKRKEQELIELNEHLEERVEQRTAKLISYQKQLRSLAMQLSRAEEEERSYLAAELHDNLGQMLAVIKMKISSIQNERDSGVIQETLQLVDDSIHYTRQLMSGLKPPPTMKEENISATLKWVIKMMDQYNLKIRFDNNEQNEPPVDENIQMTVVQAVRELLFNVVKHADSDEAHIKLSFPGNRVKVTVEDNGKGFDSCNTKFAIKEDGGFGLFHIKERLDVLGGRADIESKPGDGTRVTLIAPLKVAQKATAKRLPPKGYRQKATAIEMGKNEPIRVLLVDDHEMMREGLRKIIEGEDDLMVIAEAADGETAIDAVQQEEPDVVIMDINLPGINGIKATKIIKDKNPCVKIIGLSFHSDEDVRKEMFDAGASTYLEKADASAALCAAIRSEGLG